MRRLVCLRGVWCRLKESRGSLQRPGRAHFRQRENAPSGSWHGGVRAETRIAVVQDCGRPGHSGLGGGWVVWGLSQRSAASSLSSPSPSSTAFLRAVWCGPVDRRTGAGGLVFPGRPCPGHAVGFGIVNRQICMLLSSGSGLDEDDP